MCEDPTSRADRKAEAMRNYYEQNRESWWARRRRRGADNLFLGLVEVAERFEKLNPRCKKDEERGF